MNFNNLTRITLAAFIVACTTTVQTNAMTGQYLTALFGDLCLSAGISAMLVSKKMTVDIQEQMVRKGVTVSQLSQLKHDATKIAPYVPILISVGAVLSIVGRISMIEKATARGLALTVLSVPVNGLLIASGAYARLTVAPDAGIKDKAADTVLNLVNKLTDGKGT